MIRAGPDGRVDHALLFGLELDGHARYLLGGVRKCLHPDSTTAARFRATVRTDLSDSDKSRIFSAAARPIRMQSGMPIPWYALPATCRPGICARRASSSAWRAG